MDDYQRIKNLAHTYIECVDFRKFEALGDLFAHGALHFDLPGDIPEQVFKGSDEVVGFFSNIARDKNSDEIGRHVLTNMIIDLASDRQTAQARSYVVALKIIPGKPLQTSGVARYEDEFAKIDGEWCFTKKIIHLDYMDQG